VVHFQELAGDKAGEEKNRKYFIDWQRIYQRLHHCTHQNLQRKKNLLPLKNATKLKNVEKRIMERKYLRFCKQTDKSNVKLPTGLQLNAIPPMLVKPHSCFSSSVEPASSW